jgi:alpha-galactosidase
LVNNWGSGFQATVTVHNNGVTALNAWTVRLTLAGGQSITNLWGGVNAGTSGAIAVANTNYNGTVSAGASTSFGFVAGGNGATPPSTIGCASR